MDYKKLYFELYGEVSDLIDRLIQLQRKFEDKYIESEKDDK